MHVVIAQMTEEPEARYYSADDIFGENQSSFYDGVEEHIGDDREEDITRIMDWFGDAATTGTKRVGRKDVRWIDIDTSKTKRLFDEYQAAFGKSLRLLNSTFDKADFSRDRDIGHILHDLNEIYHFDWLYILDEFGSVTPISDFLRDLSDEEDGPLHRFYIGATYDGDQ